jgi:hypothetical protein
MRNLSIFVGFENLSMLLEPDKPGPLGSSKSSVPLVSALAASLVALGIIYGLCQFSFTAHL